MQFLLSYPVTSPRSGHVLKHTQFQLVYCVPRSKCCYVVLLRGHKAFIVGCGKYELSIP